MASEQAADDWLQARTANGNAKGVSRGQARCDHRGLIPPRKARANLIHSKETFLCISLGPSHPYGRASSEDRIAKLHEIGSEIALQNAPTNEKRGAAVARPRLARAVVMLSFLRSARNVSLPSRGLRPTRGLEPLRSVACTIRQLHIVPPPQSGLPPPIGLVDFIGFEGREYVMKEPRPDDSEKTQKIKRERELRRKEAHDRTWQHPSFQPLISVVNEVPELQLAGALLDEANREFGADPDLGKVFYNGGEVDFFDFESGEEIRDPDNFEGRVTLSLSPPRFMVIHKEEVYAGRRKVEDGVWESWNATEAELDQIVCTSPYFKLASSRSYGPTGSSRSPSLVPLLPAPTLSGCARLASSRLSPLRYLPCAA